MIEEQRLADLAAFAHIEVTSRDVEPWADLLAALRLSGYLDAEQAAWVLSLYNAYDDLGSAWAIYKRWPSIGSWLWAEDKASASDYTLTNERRGLRGGRVLRRLSSYAEVLRGQSQVDWARSCLVGDDPGADFERLTAHLRQIWGVGRQSAFEWAEFLAKVIGLPVDCADAQLWESEGPRRALQRLYGNHRPSKAWLNERAAECRSYLAGKGVQLAMVDFETVICDYNVARDGRYYPGKHLGALREEIGRVPRPDRDVLSDAFDSFVPERWREIRPGVRRELERVYHDTGDWPTLSELVAA